MTNYGVWIKSIDECCAKCRNYYPHYVWNKQYGYFSLTFDGHCCRPRHKIRRANECCDRFERCD